MVLGWPPATVVRVAEAGQEASRRVGLVSMVPGRKVFSDFAFNGVLTAEVIALPWRACGVYHRALVY